MWVGVHLSDWNTEGKLGQYSLQLRHKQLSFKPPPHPHFPGVCHWKPSPQTRQHLYCCCLPSSSSPWLACNANIYPFFFHRCNVQCCIGASWGLVRRVLSHVLVSTGRDTQRPPPDSIFPLNTELSNPNWQPFMPRIPVRKLRWWWCGGGHYLGVAGKSALVRWIYEAAARGNSSALFPHSALHFLFVSGIVWRLRF